MSSNLQLWIRGRLCEVEGYVEPADTSVGIMADGFIPEIVTDLETGREIDVNDLDDAEQREIEIAFFDQLYYYETEDM